MTNTLIVLGAGFKKSDVVPYTVNKGSIKVVLYNEIDRVKGIEFKSISFIGYVPNEVKLELLPQLR